MSETFAGKIRAAAMEIGAGGKSFTTREIAHQAGLQTRVDEKRMLNALRDFVKAGEVQRVSLGVYVYLGRQRKDLPLKDQMANLLKIKKFVTIEELRELGAAECYAREWLQMLVRRGVVADRGNGRYELIAEMAVPENEEKAERLRDLREKKKLQALQAINEAQTALDKAKKAVELIS
ncbi:MAG: hypothetical protein ACOY32_15280 [Thermodesulfobacteriota bacterium]